GEALGGGWGGDGVATPRLEVAPFAPVFHRGCLTDEQPGRLDPGAHVSELQLDCLMLADRLAEGGALLGVANGGLERGLGDADRPCGDVDPADLEAGEHHLQAASLLATDQVRDRYPVVFAADLAP